MTVQVGDFIRCTHKDGYPTLTGRKVYVALDIQTGG